MQERRGCGRKPRLYHISSRGERSDGLETGFRGERVHEWDPHWLREWCARTRPPTRYDAEAARNFYDLANVGHALEFTGEMWPCCPAWFAFKADDRATVDIADAAHDIAADSERGIGLGMVLGSDLPTRAFADLVRLAVDARSRYHAEAQARAEKEAIEKARRSAK